jgi:polar amino acid transport system substrate-binding protein
MGKRPVVARGGAAAGAAPHAARPAGAVRQRLRPLLLCLALALSAGRILAASPDSPAPAPADDGAHPLVVALAESPPFVIKESDGTWSGLSVDLWREVAAKLQLTWEPREVEVDQVEALLHDRAVDAAIGAIAIDADGELQHDFSQAYYATGLGFAQRTKGELSAGAMLGVLTSSHLVRLVALIAAATLLVGVLIAFIERRHAASEFSGPLGRGIATGVWWAAVTMTTVGYGDATPKTASGRSLALVWMFVGVVAVALLTATVTSILTLESLHGTVHHPADLAHLRLAAVNDGAGAVYLAPRHMRFTSFESHEEALAALADHRVDAVVANIPTLRYLVSRHWQGVLNVSPIILEPLLYAIGLPPESPLREPVSRAVLRIVEEDRWRDVERRYLGHP